MPGQKHRHPGQSRRWRLLRSVWFSRPPSWSVNDPLWPLDALFGARDAVEVGAEGVRGVSVTHYRLTIDLARADAALTAGETVPAGPYRRLSQIPAEVALDADGLARRIAVMADPTAGDGGTPMWSIIELWEFGGAGRHHAARFR
jgi:hypothetical protein